jgi:hypothetical protein
VVGPFEPRLSGRGALAEELILKGITQLPTGWLPEGPDDPIIVAFVERSLGGEPS